ncbi:uncharacterized protein PHACADRAFT_261845 [Phanerochaete carnosa HHB-10118-sp]|uniref:Uncharacterized protein n=1 Tax=Phanerochaete carnosa (strain HHB-10118-sp) TaxID=650164 RepID=K5VJR7_PHACS|nr:uncharacterized protein PHACADRAFT_261845 [Phanerochaete carnosa HHB-10118-sp]EKM51603.1 hypothetical protein PHACADRAFT_261845 [Phanerochaete carnosa HHB-10118-sp]
MYLSILFSSPKDTASVVSHLIPGMYKTRSSLPETCSMAVTASLLYYLVTAYPSQSRYFEHLGLIPKALLRETTRKWLRELTRALRQHDYARTEQLAGRGAMEIALGIDTAGIPTSNEPQSGSPPDLAIEALYDLLDSLRSRARDTTWTILRSAYRELSCPKPSNVPASIITRNWLLQSLLLRSVASHCDKRDDESLLDTWIQERVSRAELRPKDGAEGRWIVCKVKA